MSDDAGESTSENREGHDPRKNLAPPFKKGVSGNPGGRPKGVRAEAEKHAGKDLSKVLAFYAEVMNDKRAGFKVRLEAAQALADRAAGKPTTTAVNVDANALPDGVDLPADLVAHLAEIVPIPSGQATPAAVPDTDPNANPAEPDDVLAKLA